MTKSSLTERIKALALESGFDKVGVSPASLLSNRESDLENWLHQGFAAQMNYMIRDGLKRARPKEVMPHARSVISLALNYYTPDEKKGGDGIFGKIARYARGKDYHRIIEKKLKRLIKAIREITHESVGLKPYVDTGPIMEKAFAQQAGIGFYGKNTTILTRDLGSWIFLANVITDLELDFDQPDLGSCGSCRICLDECPTGALVAAYELDARKCISYWTIESKEAIPDQIASQMGDLVFGCDICQDVCPVNRRPKVSSEPGFAAQEGKGTWLELNSVMSLENDEAFQKQFQGTPLKRAKRSGLIRNAKAVLKNLVNN